MIKRPPRSGPVIALLFLLGNLAISGLAAQDTDAEKKAAEERLQQLLAEIQSVQRQLVDQRNEQESEQNTLRELDLQLQQINLQARDLESEKEQRLAELEQLEQQKAGYLDSLDERQATLVDQVRSAYRLGRQSRLKLLLNQDSPSELSLMLAYYDYVNRAQIEKIAGLKEALSTLDAMQRSIDGELIRLDAVQTELNAVMQDLARQRLARQEILAELDRSITDAEAALEELLQDQRDLESLIERLADVLSDIPEDLGSQVSVSASKGSLPMPLEGPVRHAFGQPRAGGIRWQGWLIGADPGTEVSAVAHGRVAFADWLRGYGLMIIIDHGEGFMSLYGKNESLYYDVGDWVEAGQAISAVGAGTGNTQGLYFELRHNGKVVDPVVWLKR